METGTEEITSEVVEESKSVKKRKNAQQNKPMIEEVQEGVVEPTLVDSKLEARLAQEKKLLRADYKDTHIACPSCGSKIFTKAGSINVVKTDQAIVKRPGKDNFYFNYEDIKGVFICSNCNTLLEVESLRKKVTELK
jgi:DNA-directed RNA polymerase subunit RPC12/RpoP